MTDELTGERLRINSPSSTAVAGTGGVNKTDYTAKGDILAGSAAGAPTPLAVAGTAGYVLTANSAEVTGLKWVALAGGGDMLKATYDPDSNSKIALAQLESDVAGTADITTHAGLTATHGAGTIASVAAATALITTHAGSTDAHIGGAGTVLSTAAATVLITTHAGLTTGVHGIAAGSAFASSADIATHAGLTATHGAGTILSMDAGTALITTHANSTAAHIGGAGTVLSVAAATILITTHAGSTDAHIGGAGTVLSVAAGTILITTHAGLTTGVHGIAAGSSFASSADIATHAGLSATHGAATIASIAAATVLITTHAGSTDAHIGGAGTVLSTAAATVLITTHANSTAAHIGGAGTVLSVAAGTVLITTHAGLTTGVHGIAAGSSFASSADIATHAGLTATHGAATIASVAAVTALITTHAGSTDAHIGGAGTIASVAAVTALITTHAGLTTGVHSLGTMAKAASADYIADAMIVAKGDLIAGSAATTPLILTVAGTTGYVLSVDSTTDTGLKWISPPAGVASGTSVAQTVFAAASAAGTSSEYSRGDHAHGTPADPVAGTAHATLVTGIHGAGTANIATTSDITTHASSTDAHIGGAGTVLSTAAATVLIQTHNALTTSIHGLAAASGFCSTAAATVLIKAHSDLTTGVHGTGTSTIADTTDIDNAMTTHAALTNVHIGGAGTVLSTAAATLLIQTHNALTTSIHGLAAASGFCSTAAATVLIQTHNALTTSIHGLAAASGFCSTAAATVLITTHAALTTVHSISTLVTKQMIENDPIWLDATMSATGMYCGICETATAGTALLFGSVCYFLAASSRYHPALANTATTSYGKLAICVAAATVGATTAVMLLGKISASIFPSMSIGAPIYISAGTLGYVTGTASSGTTGYCVRIIGYGNSATELYFYPNQTYVEMA
jgi:hypothetical protein